IDANDQGGGGRPHGVRGPPRRLEAVGSVPGPGVQHQANSLGVGLPDPERIRATMVGCGAWLLTTSISIDSPLARPALGAHFRQYFPQIREGPVPTDSSP